MAKLELDGAIILSAYEKAKNENDFSEIADLLRNRPEFLTTDILELVADKIEDKYKAPRGRPHNEKQREFDAWIAFSIYECYIWLTVIEEVRPDAVIEELSELFGLSATTIRNRLKLYKELEKEDFSSLSDYSQCLSSAKSHVDFFHRMGCLGRLDGLFGIGPLHDKDNHSTIKRLPKDEREKYKPARLSTIKSPN